MGGLKAEALVGAAVIDTREAVLEAIAEGPRSGAELADRLGVSRTAVWKHVEALREAGFEIEGGPTGYDLVSVPEYGGAAVEFGCETSFEVRYEPTVESTNARARALAAEGAADVAVLADEQTGGRGRLDREWTSPSGGVWASLLLRPPVPPAEAPLFTLAAAVAVARAAREAGVDAGIKWPNDVLVRGTERKLAGVLTEMQGEADRVSWVIVGIGVNANVDAERLPEGATSLREEVGDVNRRRFVQRLLESFDDLRGEPRAALDAWREHALTLGREVRVETPTAELVGTAVDVRPPGSLVVETGGATETVHAGDCEHLRPA